MAERRRRDERNQQFVFRDCTPNVLKGLDALPNSCISIYSFRTKSSITGFSISVSINTGNSGELTRKGVPNLSIGFLTKDEESGETLVAIWQKLLRRVDIKTVRQSYQTKLARSLAGNLYIKAAFELGGFTDLLLPPWKAKIAELTNILTESGFGIITDCTLSCRGLNSEEQAAIREQASSLVATVHSPRMS